MLLKKIFLKSIWKFEAFVIPQVPIWIYYSIKARSFTFFSALNPDMNLGGLLNYSKYSVLKNIDPNLLPKTILLKAFENSVNSIEQLISHNNFSFPVILKPDIGERGFDVFKIYDMEMLKDKITMNKNVDLLIQEYISFPIEVGVLYQRHPNSSKGTISSFAIKTFATIKGNGINSIKELIKLKGISLAKVDKTRFDINSVLKADEEQILNEIGNKSFGTCFQNVNHLVNQMLIDLFESISRQVPNFYFGRYDIKIESMERFYKGEGFKILELNGANSQPIHMFDKSLSALQTYRILWNNWKSIYLISKENNRKGIQYESFIEFYKQALKHYKTRRSKP